MRKKVKIKQKWKEKHCKTCVWLVEGALCPFIRLNGWVADKNAQKSQERGAENEKLG